MGVNRKLVRIIGIAFLALIMGFCMIGCGSQSGSDEDVSGDANGEVSEEALSGTFADNKDKPFVFETVDFDGNAVTSNDFKNARLIMVNFWEPWCGPCVGEMPELEKLYENYSDQGFVILGAFSTTDQDEDVRSIMEESNTSYPIIRANDDMNKYMTDYYPTTFFIDGSGKVLSETPEVGSHSYEEWETIVQEYLGE